MQLATKPIHEVSMISGIISNADRLVRFINTSKPKKEFDPEFEELLAKCKSLFPKCVVAFNGCQLHTMTPEERLDLKLTLLEDVKAHMENIKREISGDKVFGTVELPSGWCEEVEEAEEWLIFSLKKHPCVTILESSLHFRQKCYQQSYTE